MFYNPSFRADLPAEQTQPEESEPALALVKWYLSDNFFLSIMILFKISWHCKKMCIFDFYSESRLQHKTNVQPLFLCLISWNRMFYNAFCFLFYLYFIVSTCIGMCNTFQNERIRKMKGCVIIWWSLVQLWEDVTKKNQILVQFHYLKKYKISLLKTTKSSTNYSQSLLHSSFSVLHQWIFFFISDFLSDISFTFISFKFIYICLICQKIYRIIMNIFNIKKCISMICVHALTKAIARKWTKLKIKTVSALWEYRILCLVFFVCLFFVPYL